MELNSILFSQITWAGKLAQPVGGLHITRVVQAMRDLCGFVEFPRNLGEFNFSNGVKFKHGNFNSNEIKAKQVVIGELTIFTNGLIVSSTASTEDMDVFLTSLFQQLKDRLQTEFLPAPGDKKGYLSNLEVTLETPIPLTKPEQAVANKLDECFATYGNEGRSFEKSSFSLSFDTTEPGTTLASQFTIARRAGMPYPSNSYFSEAPLSTSDHITILEEFENALLDD